MIDSFLIDHPTFAVGAWAVLYVSDYYLTLWGARLYQSKARAFVELGSYEMEPIFQKDIDALRKVSPRFLGYLLFSSAGLLLIWWMSLRWVDTPAFYLLVVGAYFLVELMIHMRHVRNIVLFRALGVPGAIEGHVRYARWVTEQTHVVELGAFAALFAICYVVSGQIMFAGGVLGCLGTLHRHARNARRPSS
jgi:hypothetical protein